MAQSGSRGRGEQQIRANRSILDARRAAETAGHRSRADLPALRHQILLGHYQGRRLPSSARRGDGVSVAQREAVHLWGGGRVRATFRARGAVVSRGCKRGRPVRLQVVPGRGGAARGAGGVDGESMAGSTPRSPVPRGSRPRHIPHSEASTTSRGDRADRRQRDDLRDANNLRRMGGLFYLTTPGLEEFHDHERLREDIEWQRARGRGRDVRAPHTPPPDAPTGPPTTSFDACATGPARTIA